MRFGKWLVLAVFTLAVTLGATAAFADSLTFSKDTLKLGKGEEYVLEAVVEDTDGLHGNETITYASSKGKVSVVDLVLACKDYTDACLTLSEAAAMQSYADNGSSILIQVFDEKSNA